MLENIIIPQAIINRFVSLMNIDYEDLLKTRIGVNLTCARIIDDMTTVVEEFDKYFDRDNSVMIRAYDEFVIIPFKIGITMDYFIDKMIDIFGEDSDDELLSECKAFAVIVRTIITDRVPLHDDNAKMARNAILAASACDVAREIWLSIEERLKSVDPFFFSTYQLYQSLLGSNMCEIYGKDIIELCVFSFINNTVRMNLIVNDFEDPLSKEESDELLRIGNKIIDITKSLTDSNADDDDVMALADLIDKQDAYINQIMHKYSDKR